MFEIMNKNKIKIMEHPEIYQKLEELYEKEKHYIMYERQAQLENEWRQWEEEQEKLKSPAKIILQINLKESQRTSVVG